MFRKPIHFRDWSVHREGFGVPKCNKEQIMKQLSNRHIRQDRFTPHYLCSGNLTYIRMKRCRKMSWPSMYDINTIPSCVSRERNTIRGFTFYTYAAADVWWKAVHILPTLFCTTTLLKELGMQGWAGKQHFSFLDQGRVKQPTGGFASHHHGSVISSTSITWKMKCMTVPTSTEGLSRCAQDGSSGLWSSGQVT